MPEQRRVANGDQLISPQSIFNNLQRIANLGRVASLGKNGHHRPIQIEDGLVDGTALLDYMDDCYCEHLSMPRDPATHQPEFHHIYFPMPMFKDDKVPLPIKKLRGSRYNQYRMLSCQEDYYHQQHHEEVPLDEISLDAAEQFLQETYILDDFAATSAAIYRSNHEAPSSEMTRTEKSRHAARSSLMYEVNEATAERMGSIELMPQQVVYGALSRYVRRNPEPFMLDFLLSSPAVETPTITTKVYSEGYMKSHADTVLNRKIATLSWSMRRLLLPEGSKLLYEGPLNTTVAA